MSGLTFNAFAEINAARARRWHPGFPNDTGWNGADWSNAMCGEAGEAANVVKKLRRHEEDLSNAGDGPPVELRAALGEEIADTITYAFLLAEKYGIDVATEVATKFNKVSEKQGFPERIVV